MTLVAVAFELARPLWLLVLLAAPLFVWLTVRTAAGRLRAGDTAALAARLLLLLAIALALAVPRIRVDAPFRSVAYVMDLSDSVPPDALDRAREFVQRSAGFRKDDDDASLVVFADGAAVEAPFTRISAEQRLETVPVDPDHIGSVIPRGETDLEGALRLARAGFPPGGSRRIVVTTDGNQTRGDAEAVVRELITSGVDVQVFPLRYEREREVSVRKLVAPASAPRDQPVPIRAVVDSTHDGVRATLRYLVGGEEVAVQEETLSAGRNVFEMGTAFRGPGFHTIEVVVEPEIDGDPRNNRGVAATQVSGPGRVLFATTRTDSDLAAALAEELAIPVDVGTPDSLPANAGEYAPYDVVVIENVPSFALSEVQRRQLRAAVQDLGVGLVCVGGEQTYGPGGYAGTEIEEVLPLSSEIRNKRVLPSGALVVILHTCEFAGGNEAARRITKAAIDALSAQDEIGVLEWGEGGDTWVIPLQRVGDKAKHYGAIDRAEPWDMPSFDPSMKLAENALRQSTAAAKHMIIISDGDPSPPNLKLAAAMREQRITISTVCVEPHTPGSSSTMRQLSAENGGNHYDVSARQLDRLPQIFIKEAVTVRRSAWRDEAFAPTLVGVHSMLRGFSEEELPALRGYVVTTLKDKAEPLMGASHDDPLLAWWRYGLGECAAWASDAGPRWSPDWLSWGGYGRFWGQVVRAVARSLERPGVQVDTDLEGGVATIVMNALEADGSFRNGLTVEGTIVRPDGETQPFRVVQKGPGRYVGTVPAQAVGTHVASLIFTDPDTGTVGQALAAVCVSYSAEHLAQSSNERLLAKLEAAGATILDPEPPPGPDGAPPPDVALEPWSGELVSAAEPLDLWPWLAGLAALLLVGDVAVRRLRLKLPRWKRPQVGVRAADKPKPLPDAERIARPRPSGTFQPGEVPPPKKARSQQPSAPPSPAPPRPSGDDGLLGAKKRAKKKQDWEENP